VNGTVVATEERGVTGWEALCMMVYRREAGSRVGNRRQSKMTAACHDSIWDRPILILHLLRLFRTLFSQ
jgi:hypothetical protein